jgi:hypothetical protein
MVINARTQIQMYSLEGLVLIGFFYSLVALLLRKLGVPESWVLGSFQKDWLVVYTYQINEM